MKKPRKKQKGTSKPVLGASGITPQALDRVVNLIVEKNYSLKRIAFEMGVTYATLIRRINGNPEAKSLIDEAREVAIFEVGLEMVSLADNAEKDNIFLTQLQINTRRDSALMSMKMRDTISKGKSTKDKQVVVNVGVCVVPAKQEISHSNNSPRLVVDNSRVLEHK